MSCGCITRSWAREGFGVTRLLCRAALALIAVLISSTGSAAERPEDTSPQEQARQLWEAGYIRHAMGLYDAAIESFRASIALHPTAEAHTFLGWTYSHVGKLAEAISECGIAIQIDPEFGNPYNDIGVYLLELGKVDETIPWFEKAIAAKRYCCYQFAHANLGRVLLAQGKLDEAKRSFERALEHDPAYLPALIGVELIKQMGAQQLL
jgi:Tfp pilus assembly protein PilF